MTEPVRCDTRDPFKEMRIVDFSRNVDEWPKWSKKFMAIAKVKKFADIIDGSVTVPALTDNMEAKDIAIRDMDQGAYCCLLHCMIEDISFALAETLKNRRPTRWRCSIGMENFIN